MGESGCEKFRRIDTHSRCFYCSVTLSTNDIIQGLPIMTDDDAENDFEKFWKLWDTTYEASGRNTNASSPIAKKQTETERDIKLTTESP